MQMKRTAAIQNLISEQPWLQQELKETTNFTFKSKTKLNIPPQKVGRKLKLRKSKAQESSPLSLNIGGANF